MSRKELNSLVNKYCKYVNEHQTEFGLEEKVAISTKLSIEEIELNCEVVGEKVSEHLGNDVPEEFINYYTEIGEKIEELKSQDGIDDKGNVTKEKTKLDKVNRTDHNSTPSSTSAKDEADKTQKKNNPKKTNTGKKSKAVTVDVEKDKAIKKMYDLLPPEAIDVLDTNTMRTILLSFK